MTMVDEGPSQWDGFLHDGAGISKELHPERIGLEKVYKAHEESEKHSREELEKESVSREKARLDAQNATSAKKKRDELLSEISNAKGKEYKVFRCDMPHMTPQSLYEHSAVFFYYRDIDREAERLSDLKDDEINFNYLISHLSKFYNFDAWRHYYYRYTTRCWSWNESSSIFEKWR